MKKTFFSSYFQNSFQDVIFAEFENPKTFCTKMTALSIYNAKCEKMACFIVVFTEL